MVPTGYMGLAFWSVSACGERHLGATTALHRMTLRKVAPRTLACTGADHRAYFMPESAMPSVMYRCRNRKMIMMGIDAIAAPAMINPWNDPFS